MSPRIRQVLNGAIFLAGLAFCVVALVRLQTEHPLTLSASAPTIVAFFLLAAAALLMIALAWQRYVLAFVGAEPPLAEAAYQSWLMLVAKYVPIMIAGFIARIASYAGRVPAHRVVLATLTELVGAIAAATVVGLVCLAWLLVPIAVPFIIVAAIVGILLAPNLLMRMFDVVARFRRIEHAARGFIVGPDTRRALRTAFALQMLQWVALAGFVATSAHGVAAHLAVPALIAVSGAYALAVVVGIAIVFLPGGIGAREAAFTWIAAGFVDTTEALQLALALRIAMSALDLIAGVGCVALRISLAAHPAHPAPPGGDEA